MDAPAKALDYGADCEATVLGQPSAAFVAEVVQSLELPAALVQTGKGRPGDEGRLPLQAALLHG
jgi:hypothetical protein